jgi:hypothetical protein
MNLDSSHKDYRCIKKRFSDRSEGYGSHEVKPILPVQRCLRAVPLPLESQIRPPRCLRYGNEWLTLPLNTDFQLRRTDWNVRRCGEETPVQRASLCPVTQEAAGSSPVAPANILNSEIGRRTRPAIG